MGFHPAWKYEEVHELVFESGILESESDLSSRMAEIRDKVFEPFFSTKPSGEGTGLGLSVSYGIIKEHNGTITVNSEPGEGSLFTIVLPPLGGGKS